MPLILTHLPIPTEEAIAFAREESVRIRPYEIVIWVSLSTRNALTAGVPFPALLDTAHTHNFLIRQEHLGLWAGLEPTAFPVRGAIRQQGTRVPLRVADVWVHPNRPGSWERAEGGEPFRLTVPEGIAVYPEGEFPRLPLLGLRALIHNKLVLTVDGERAEASLRTKRRWWFFG